ncbi:MAG: hypothetical protein CMO82_13340 [Winogradskyella sp.]|jgi:predicted RNase H-like nuclease (RuvC/YqgF family)|uniref:Ribbon-helix-helix protein, CopG family n=1 Tax=Winogradskyella poriferorum TaxID=307627 RepID=A0ABU7W729_9FLAO|nr:hypothetical protein [Winogradskyella sp.]|tara:strand:- start:3953 stop:4453 length:501 start_codon:yes stop_codon:yes gene_type:complete
MDTTRNVTISFKTTAEEKTALQQIANDKNISRSELIASIVNGFKNQYDYIGKTSPKEKELNEKLNNLLKENRKLILSLENAEHRIEIEQKANQKYVKEQLEMNKTIFDMKGQLKTAKKDIASLNEQLISIEAPNRDDTSPELLWGSLGSLLISGLALFFAPRLFNH